MKGSFTILQTAIAVAIGCGTLHAIHNAPQWKSPQLLTPVQRSTSAAPDPTQDWEGPVIYGSVYYNVNEQPDEYGMYAVDAATGKITPVSLTDHINAIGSGIYDNGVYRFVSVTEDNHAIYYEYNVSDWSKIKEERLPDMSNVALDEAFDPVTGNVYGCFLDEKGYGAVFGYVDHDTHTRTAICNLDAPYFAVIATPEGLIYAVSADGKLLQLDKETGRPTVIGALGFTPKYNQTAVCDLHTGRVYWLAASNTGSSGLYEIDLQSGKANLIRNFSKREGLVGAFIAQHPWVDGAPDAATGLSLDFNDADTSGKITFTMPEKTIDGTPLSGKLQYNVFINSKAFNSGSAAPGQQVSLDATLPEGKTIVVVSVKSAAGYGRIARINSHVGYDAPAAVRNLRIEQPDESTVTLSWDAPTEGYHGGFLDTSDISYKIVRYPGGTVISSGLRKTTFTQKLSTKQYAVYHYEIIPQSHKNMGETAESDYISVGPAYNIPFYQAFTDEAVAKQYVAMTTDWSYDSSAAAYIFGGGSDDAGNYLFAPAMNLSADQAYLVRLTASATGTREATITVKAGRAIKAGALEADAFSAITVSGTEDKEYECYIHPTTSGVWYLALNASGGSVNISSIEITAGPSSQAPAMVSDLKVTAAADGSAKADISFTTPTEDIAGNRLTTLSKAIIYREGKIIEEIPNPTPGAKLNYTDTHAPLTTVTYEVRAENAAGKGLPASASAYVGEDIPVAPTNIHLTDRIENVTVTWDAPTQGINGAYINPADLLYTVLRSDDNIVAENMSGTSFEDDTDFSGAQHFLQYAVMASSSTGNGAYGISDAIVVGSPYTLPFYETFPQGGLDNAFWEARSNGASVALSAAQGNDNQPGCIKISPKAENDAGSLVSGKISLEGATHPVLIYNYTATCGAKAVLKVNAIMPDGSSHTIDEINFASLSGDNGWRRSSASLLKYMDQPYVRIEFNFSSADLTGTSIDGISIDGTSPRDLTLAINTVRSIKAGESVKVTTRVTNDGWDPAEKGSYCVNLYKDGKLADSVEGETIEPFTTKEIALTLNADIFDPASIEVYAEVVTDQDAIPENNLSRIMTVSVDLPKFPAPHNLQGSVDADDNISLQWNEPAAEEFTTLTVTDDVESYESFAIDNIGDWTVVDLDQQLTFGIGDGAGSFLAYPNALDPKGFIVFDAPLSGVQVHNSFGQPTKWTPHSGDKMFVSFQASGSASDDWLISPSLSGKAQTVSLYIKSVDVNNNGEEEYEILYSSTGTDPDDFTPVTSVMRAPGEWAEIKVDIPAGAKYFAIHAVSAGKFALLVDDISYSPYDFSDLKLKGYNVYCNQTLINDSPVSERQFSGLIHAGMADYQVSAVYDLGESQPTEAVRLISAGIHSVAGEEIQVSTVDGNIIIDHAEGQACAIYTIDGRCIFTSQTMPDKASIHVGTGIYIAKIGHITVKIIVTD